MVCSDAMAMIRETNQYMEIHDQELVIVKADSVEVQDYDGNSRERASYTAELDLSDIGKGTYPYYMLKEIDEQPTVMRKLIQAYTDEAGQVVVDPAIIKAVQDADRIYILAAGTSYHAGFASKKMLEELTDTPVELGISSEWGYGMPLLSKKPLFIFISQSGETADSRQVLVKANELGIPSLTVTNVPGSTLSREANHTMLLHAGPEIAVASTKAYTAQIAALAFLAKAVGEANGNAKAQAFDLIRELSIVAQSIESTLSEKETIDAKIRELLETTRNAFYIGRGQDYYVAMEASLKLKEISYIQCEGFAAGELKHGTIALIEEGTPVLALLSDPVLANHTRGNIQEVAARGAKVLTIAEENVKKILEIEQKIGSGKLVISAHDGHIQKENPIYNSMGVLLTKDFGEAYYAIGTDVWKVTDNIKVLGEAKRTVQSFVSVDPLAAQARFAKDKQYLLDFSDIKEGDSLYSLINSPLRMGSLGEGYTWMMRIVQSSYRPKAMPSGLYDAMIFVYEGSPIEIIE